MCKCVLSGVRAVLLYDIDVRMLSTRLKLVAYPHQHCFPAPFFHNTLCEFMESKELATLSNGMIRIEMRGGRLAVVANETISAGHNDRSIMLVHGEVVSDAEFEQQKGSTFCIRDCNNNIVISFGRLVSAFKQHTGTHSWTHAFFSHLAFV